MIGEAIATRKASLALAGISPVKAMIKKEKSDGKLHDYLECLFNPTSINFTKGTKWVEDNISTSNTGLKTFSGGEAARLQIELFFDTTDTGDNVADKYVNKLLKLMNIDKSLPKMPNNEKRPPKVRFDWGKFSSAGPLKFDAYIPTVNVQFNLFLADGTPLRATCDVSFVEYDDYEKQKPGNPTSVSEARKIWRVTEGETLDWIAYREYGDSAYWRHIAQTNNLSNPRDLRAGQVLKLVPLP